MEEWKTYKIGNLCSISSSKRIFAKEYQSSGIPFFRGKEIIEKQKGESVSTELYISKSRYDEIKNKFGVPKEGDMLLTSVGTLGIPYIVKNETFYFKDGNLTWFTDFKEINSKFLYYWFLSPIAKNAINAKAIGSTQKALTIDALSKFEIDIPNIDTQNRIVSILSSLDSKIELNRRINDNLEQQAQAWLNELLDRYANSTTVLIHEIAEINPKRNLSKGTSAKCIEMANLPTTGSFPNGWIEKEYNGGMKFCNGDTLIARITPCLENGKTAFINFLDKNEIAYGSTEYIVISAKSNYSSSFFYFLARNHDFVDYAVKNMNGSSGRQRVSGDTISKYRIPVIPREKLESFTNHAEIALKTIKNNSLQNMRLSMTRDALLPKLMSGELKVNDLNS
ncbi:restriction endonuclease subunit S [Bacteroides intestinalis]|uniref:restriction endonuclease subunit S n=1 Tax=Bacteroides intestinalis TaxID=329854 RepID=UPI003219991D